MKLTAILASAAIGMGSVLATSPILADEQQQKTAESAPAQTELIRAKAAQLEQLYSQMQEHKDKLRVLKLINAGGQTADSTIYVAGTLVQLVHVPTIGSGAAYTLQTLAAFLPKATYIKNLNRRDAIASLRSALKANVKRSVIWGTGAGFVVGVTASTIEATDYLISIEATEFNRKLDSFITISDSIGFKQSGSVITIEGNNKTLQMLGGGSAMAFNMDNMGRE